MPTDSRAFLTNRLVYEINLDLFCEYYDIFVFKLTDKQIPNSLLSNVLDDVVRAYKGIILSSLCCFEQELREKCLMYLVRKTSGYNPKTLHDYLFARINSDDFLNGKFNYLGNYSDVSLHPYSMCNLLINSLTFFNSSDDLFFKGRLIGGNLLIFNKSDKNNRNLVFEQVKYQNEHLTDRVVTFSKICIKDSENDLDKILSKKSIYRKTDNDFYKIDKKAIDSFSDAELQSLYIQKTEFNTRNTIPFLSLDKSDFSKCDTLFKVIADLNFFYKKVLSKPFSFLEESFNFRSYNEHKKINKRFFDDINAFFHNRKINLYCKVNKKQYVLDYIKETLVELNELNEKQIIIKNENETVADSDADFNIEVVSDPNYIKKEEQDNYFSYDGKIVQHIVISNVDYKEYEENLINLKNKKKKSLELDPDSGDDFSISTQNIVSDINITNSSFDNHGFLNINLGTDDDLREYLNKKLVDFKCNLATKLDVIKTELVIKYEIKQGKLFIFDWNRIDRNLTFVYRQEEKKLKNYKGQKIYYVVSVYKGEKTALFDYFVFTSDTENRTILLMGNDHLHLSNKIVEEFNKYTGGSCSRYGNKNINYMILSHDNQKCYSVAITEHIKKLLPDYSLVDTTRNKAQLARNQKYNVKRLNDFFINYIASEGKEYFGNLKYEQWTNNVIKNFHENNKNEVDFKELLQLLDLKKSNNGSRRDAFIKKFKAYFGENFNESAFLISTDYKSKKDNKYGLDAYINIYYQLEPRIMYCVGASLFPSKNEFKNTPVFRELLCLDQTFDENEFLRYLDMCCVSYIRTGSEDYTVIPFIFKYVAEVQKIFLRKNHE